MPHATPTMTLDELLTVLWADYLAQAEDEDIIDTASLIASLEWDE